MLHALANGEEAAAAVSSPKVTGTAVEQLLRLPILELLARANSIHIANHDPNDIQKASLLSIKTGGCPEDCAYCPQSAHHREVSLTKEHLMQPQIVVALAKKARAAGAERFCMGAAWRKARDGREFDAVLEMVRGVNALGMESCVTLGMLEPHHAQQLAEAGLTAYNHNLDTSPEFYGNIIGTRTYQDRLQTLDYVRKAGVEICCGGIIGMGESWQDRAQLLAVLANFSPPPESVPINKLIPVAGTPLADQPPVPALDLVRMIAAARIIMPRSRLRLSAGRDDLTLSEQLLCFMAGANSIFFGDVLLTAPNASENADSQLLDAIAAL
ncbi:biotin synthase BioB [Polycladidibacter hongkongensis]|uniref:biotin synthase BioB n=1 Tax=Polycladidibacter hongkongensis TaxID=1647556 RepID=UPI0009E9A6E4|nr:biotin synthase BioB [Pseudovibrio hongkongensis]